MIKLDETVSKKRKSQKNFTKCWELSERSLLSSVDAATNCAWPRKARLSARLSTKNCLSYLGLAIQPCLATGSSTRG